MSNRPRPVIWNEPPPHYERWPFDWYELGMHYDHVHVSFIPMHILIGTWLDVLKFIIKLLFALLIMSEPSKFLGKLMLALIVDRWRRRW